jgi:hypothetical protein
LSTTPRIEFTGRSVGIMSTPNRYHLIVLVIAALSGIYSFNKIT